MKSAIYKIIFTFLLASAGSASGSSFDSSGASNNAGAAGVGVAFFGVTGLSVYADVSQRNFLQAALGFALSRPEASSVIVGVTTAAELSAIVAAALTPLPDLDWDDMALDDPIALDSGRWGVVA